MTPSIYLTDLVRINLYPLSITEIFIKKSELATNDEIASLSKLKLLNILREFI